MTGTPDRAALTAGLAVSAVGAVLLLDQLGAARLDFGALAPLLLAALGVVLLAAGLGRDRR